MSPSYLVAVVGLVALFGGAQAQEGIPCHSHFFQFTPRHNLNVSQYMGKWHMQETACSYIGNCPEVDYRCAERTLTLPNDTDITNINARDTFINETSGSIVDIISTGTVNNTRSPFTAMWYLDTNSVEFDVIILAADLEFAQWTVVYQCGLIPTEDSFYRRETVTAMTRDRQVTPELRATLKALMVGVGFRIGDHSSIDQTNCD